ncbi:hypothetical protein VNI00_010218 [Paramarasmius palmivorus]|uniref:Uncharacterized protein n=1 Tax=Paramarasmius palmivorus TaxID=297713 RepID=A0AAW0CIU3_9AGAR
MSAATYAWPFALPHSEASLVVVCVIYGLSICSLSRFAVDGTFIILARALGTLLGPPLSGYAGEANQRFGMGVFSGEKLPHGRSYINVSFTRAKITQCLLHVFLLFCRIDRDPSSFKNRKLAMNTSSSSATLPITNSDTGVTIALKDAEKYEIGTPSTPQDVYPDGGLRAWLNVLGTFMNAFITFIWLYKFMGCMEFLSKIFQAYYQLDLLDSSSSSSM